MTMRNIYELSLKDKLELTKKVKKLGNFLRKEFIEEYLENVEVYRYKNNTYWISSYHGIIDVK